MNASTLTAPAVSPPGREELGALVTRIEASVQAHTHVLASPTISNGWLGACLFYCYYARYTGNDAYFELAAQYLDKALALVDYKYYQRIYPTDSYDANIAALGIFFIRSREKGLLDFDVSPYLATIEDTLHLLCQNKIRHADFSIFSGALATGNYLLLASRTDRNDQLLTEIVEAIAAHAVEAPSGGIYWVSPRLHNKVYLGLSHGSCMIISFLCAVLERGLLVDECRSLIERAAAFVLQCRRPNPKGLFPHVLGEEVENTQFSLCYGDLGVGYGLLRGGLALNDEALVAAARDILAACLDRTYEDGLTYDGSMTYGASGLAYLYRKLAKLDPRGAPFERAYAYWVQQIPRNAKEENGFCGFRSFFKPESDLFNLSYAWGILGIGITLMQYLEPDLPVLEGINHGI
ncbi:lanthionine synthetase LanC family protein [Pontibacter indicus]|uniref:Lanthionine synthetase C-like protein n=1 Tax=Pontibacter indicus TaxID=1317125 RepID=A0A1R3XQ32_9BACT|nr:lanthionine synthetase LanC family protein [Pontibacter indicus]SIT93988.1 Lanthionine synthetase C-like protein [Pontibacter indicus]